MAAQKWQDLGSLVSHLATDCVLVQRRLDAAVAQKREQFASLLASVAEPARSLLLPLAPTGIAVTEYRVDCTLRVVARDTRARSLTASFLQAGYSSLYDTTSSEQSSLSVEVRAVPTVLSTALPVAPKG